MTNSRIASAFLAPALAAILAVACSSSDNNGGGTSVGGNGSGTGGSGPSAVTNKAACNDALTKVKKCAKTPPSAADEKQLLDACNAAKTTCATCIIDADTDCDAMGECLIGEVCAPAPAGEGGTGGTSSGKGGTGGTSSGKGGTGGSGGSQSTDPEACLGECFDANQEGSDFFNEAFIAECACKADATCASECASGCTGGEPTEACNSCLEGVANTDKCVAAANTACQGDSSCNALIECATGCDSGGSGSGGSGGGTGGQACANECAKNNPDGIEAFNADQQNLTKCLCEGASCKDKCADSPICTNGQPQASQECVGCQDSCFSGCTADAACKALYECIQGCN